ncbi:hypothetical protein EVAR_61085_1 [Eumeta japonica]|uniref:Uncharacterized protein n=1 Tax=Eumeta variegata TaxID=151549 RepID=A0A4C1YQ16_EUMVA|nr:hypothetical protein EVAR_61085_1 [Eumeta japonica]
MVGNVQTFCLCRARGGLGRPSPHVTRSPDRPFLSYAVNITLWLRLTPVDLEYSADACAPPIHRHRAEDHESRRYNIHLLRPAGDGD